MIFIEDLLGSIFAGLSVYIAYKEFKNPRKQEVYSEQLYKVYLPLFLEIEPYLYKDIDKLTLNNIISKFNEIKQNHYEYIHSDTLNEFQILERNLNNNRAYQENFISLCKIIDYRFEKLRKSLNLPTRKFDYKLNNRQYGKEILSIIDTSLKLILKICFLFIIGLLFIFMSDIFTAIFSKLTNLLT